MAASIYLVHRRWNRIANFVILLLVYILQFVVGTALFGEKGNVISANDAPTCYLYYSYWTTDVSWRIIMCMPISNSTPTGVWLNTVKTHNPNSSTETNIKSRGAAPHPMTSLSWCCYQETTFSILGCIKQSSATAKRSTRIHEVSAIVFQQLAKYVGLLVLWPG